MSYWKSKNNIRLMESMRNIILGPKGLLDMLDFLTFAYVCWRGQSRTLATMPRYGCLLDCLTYFLSTSMYPSDWTVENIRSEKFEENKSYKKYFLSFGYWEHTLFQIILLFVFQENMMFLGIVESCYIELWYRGHICCPQLLHYIFLCLSFLI